MTPGLSVVSTHIVGLPAPRYTCSCSQFYSCAQISGIKRRSSEADTQNADLVMMPSHSFTFYRFLMGSVTNASHQMEKLLQDTGVEAI